MVYTTHCRYTPMQYILEEGNITEVNPYVIQLFHSVYCIQLKGQLQAALFTGKLRYTIMYCICCLHVTYEMKFKLMIKFVYLKCDLIKICNPCNLCTTLATAVYSDVTLQQKFSERTLDI